MDLFEPTGIASDLVDVLYERDGEYERIVLERVTSGTVKVTVTPHGERPYESEFFSLSDSS